jgi:hypothetical protein
MFLKGRANPPGANDGASRVYRFGFRRAQGVLAATPEIEDEFEDDLRSGYTGQIFAFERPSQPRKISKPGGIMEMTMMARITKE